ncbi:substrate-binding domain-containing protein [Pseudomonas sp. MMS21-TM103]|uniref:substrate-binding domain-containing protein n=1 Tax=Pseudomonas sp. MMS21 TM103 TaxID=2886506 RepID=UPI001EDF989E|nr:substrate-binding domain-containing protein [Pseudomonas sp. MMS21 TM103]MCG4455845.1 substrate-binding domain-containing protein [Pseudomonas sp. MMS21 TM103]
MKAGAVLCLLSAGLLGLLITVSHADWTGPQEGPVALPDKRVVFLASDFRNGGVVAVYRSVERAARLIGWRVQALDGHGDPAEWRRMAEQALQQAPDGVVLGGFGVEALGELPVQFKQREITLVGWHAGDAPGPSEWLFSNVTTDPQVVADLAADLIIGEGAVGVVIFTDSQFAIARAKTKRMAQRIRECLDCRLLSIEDLPIARVSEQIADRVTQLQQRFGSAWTHSLAINDVYFDHIHVPLARLGRQDIRHVSAGDGSARALARIHSGLSQQIATVAEPLGAHGWQVVDELNRAFSGEPPSGYVARPLLVTTEVLRESETVSIKLDTSYEAIYLQLWRPD